MVRHEIRGSLPRFARGHQHQAKVRIAAFGTDELIAIDHLLPRARRVHQQRVRERRVACSITKDGHEWRDARAAGEQQQRSPLVRAPDKVSTERPSNLDGIAGLCDVDEVGGDLSILEPFHCELDERLAGSRGDGVAPLRLVSVGGGEAYVEVLPCVTRLQRRA